MIIHAELRDTLKALNTLRANNIGSFIVRALAITGGYSRSCSGQFGTEADVSVILLMKVGVIHSLTVDNLLHLTELAEVQAR